jgi:hypothetical protein
MNHTLVHLNMILPSVRPSLRVLMVSVMLIGTLLQAENQAARSSDSAPTAATKLYSAPASVDRSPDFAVTVDGQEAFVFYVADNQYRRTYLPGADTTSGGQEREVVRNPDEEKKKPAVHTRESWVSFETGKSVSLRIRPLAAPQALTDLLLIDERGTAIEQGLDGSTITFTATAGHKYLLILNRDFSRRLTVFAEIPEQDVPDMNAAGTFVIRPGTPRADYENTTKETLYFTAGLHEMGDLFPLKPGLQIYLAPGAYVRGFFTCPPNADTAGASGVKIFGRGVLSGESNPSTTGPNDNFLPRPLRFWSNSIYLGGLNREPADNQIVKDITIIYPSQPAIVGSGTHTLIDNVKVFSFDREIGGICVGAQSTVKDSYISTDIRALTTLGSDTTFTRNLIVGFEGCIPFFMGSRILDDLKNITFEDSTVLGDWSDLVNIQQDHFGNLSNITVRNIQAFYTGAKNKASLLKTGIGFSPYRRDQYNGSIKNVTVRDITITALRAAPTITAEIFGFSEQASVRDIMVQNVRVNGAEATFQSQIEQCAYNITIGKQTIREGQRPVAKTPPWPYPAVPAVADPGKTYARKDKDGDEHGRRIAHAVAYPTEQQKADPSFPKSLSAAFGNTATGASLKGIRTISAPRGDFLQTYAAVSDPRMHVLHSPDYEIVAAQKSSGTRAARVQVYENIGTLVGGSNGLAVPPPMMTEHFANFTHRGPVELTVKMKDRAPAIKDVLIMPTALQSTPVIAADRRSFTFALASPQYLVVIINGDWLRPLFVFGNPPEDPVPDPQDPAVLTIKTSDDFKTLANRRKLADYRVINFAPGYHDIGLFFPIFSDQTIYIPGDAYVAGTILGVARDKANKHAYGTKIPTKDEAIFDYAAFKQGYRKASDYVFMGAESDPRSFFGTIENFTIRGRGMLASDQMDWFKGQENVPSYVILVDKDGRNGVLDGITLTSRHFHSANFMGGPALLSNVKTLFGFHGNTDASQWGMVRRNLFSVQMDDGTYIHNGLDIDGWLSWQQNNANNFCFVRSMPKDGNTLGHAVIRNVTVIDGRYGANIVNNPAASEYNPMRGGFWLGINHDRKGHNYAYVADVVMQNITFETIVNPLFQFAPMTGSKFNKMIGIEDITFDNIRVPMGQHWKSIFGGRTGAPDDVMRNIVIRDLVIGGKKITDLDEFARVRSDGRNLEVRIQ